MHDACMMYVFWVAVAAGLDPVELAMARSRLGLNSGGSLEATEVTSRYCLMASSRHSICRINSSTRPRQCNSPCAE